VPRRAPLAIEKALQEVRRGREEAGELERRAGELREALQALGR
jgi:hypothetical protein